MRVSQTMALRRAASGTQMLPQPVPRKRLPALPLTQLAAEVMTNSFKPEYEPGIGLTELAVIVDTFLPPHGEFTGAIYKKPRPSAAEYSIRDSVYEAAQLLEHAGLLILK